MAAKPAKAAERELRIVFCPVGEQRVTRVFGVHWRADDNRQVTGELRLPADSDEPHKVVGSIRVRWKSFTDEVLGPMARWLPGRDRVDPATTPEDVDIDIDGSVLGREVILRRTHPVNRGSYWELNPASIKWLAHINLFPQEIPPPRDAREM